MKGPPTPADYARIALRRIAELCLPPTPQNYAQHYYEAANETPPAPPAAPDTVDSQLVQRVDDLVAQASATTEHLVSGLDRQNGDLANSLESLVEAGDGVDTTLLLQEVVATTRDIHAIVAASRLELQDTRRSLAEIKAELVESRNLLGQDQLTGTENRRGMSMILDREIARARRDHEPLAVAMIDVDHFKLVNDKHGHAAGDAALVHLTRLAKAMLRGNDAFVRYGGEEFVLVLPETAMQGAAFTAGRLRLLLEKNPLRHGDKEIPMTFSAGVAVLKDDDSEQSLLARADAGLYRAKHSGRNCVVISE